MPQLSANDKVALIDTLSTNSSPLIIPIVLNPYSFPNAATAAI